MMKRKLLKIITELICRVLRFYSLCNSFYYFWKHPSEALRVHRDWIKECYGQARKQIYKVLINS